MSESQVIFSEQFHLLDIDFHGKVLVFIYNWILPFLPAFILKI